MKLSTRKSKDFPYGLYKLENVVTVVLAVMIFVTAYEIASDALFTPMSKATVAPRLVDRRKVSEPCFGVTPTCEP